MFTYICNIIYYYFSKIWFWYFIKLLISFKKKLWTKYNTGNQINADFSSLQVEDNDLDESFRCHKDIKIFQDV